MAKLNLAGAIVGMLVFATSAGEVAAWAQLRVPAEPAAITAREVHGSGDWKTDGKAHGGAPGWNLDVRRAADSSIHGRIIVADSPLFSSGNVRRN